MRLRMNLLFVVLLAIVPRAASAQPTVTVPLHLQEEIGPAKAAADTVRKLAVQLLESSGLDTATHPEVLKQSVPAVQDRYRRVVAGECLVLTYASPVRIATQGGDVSVFEIVIGMSRPDRADAVFTIDGAGRVVAHEKYSGRIAVALRKAADVAVGAR